MKVVSLISQKGGTTKTATATNLAVVAAMVSDLETVIIDLDPQTSACEWAAIRGDDPPLVVAAPVARLEHALRAAEAGGAELVFIDTAGRTNDAAVAAARFADLILVPVQPSLVDLKTVEATMSLIRLVGNREVRVLLTRVKGLGNRHDDAIRWLNGQGFRCCPTTIGDRVVYQDAFAQGRGVTEVEPDGKAAAEISSVYIYASRIAGFSRRRVSSP